MLTPSKLYIIPSIEKKRKEDEAIKIEILSWIVFIIARSKSLIGKKVTSSNNLFDALNTIEEGDELRSNGGSSNSGKKVVQEGTGSASSSPSNTPLVIKVNDLESKMIEGSLVLLDDNGKPLKLSKSTLPSSSNVVSKKVDDLVNEDNDSEVGGGNKSLYEQWRENYGEDPYDDDGFDDHEDSAQQAGSLWPPIGASALSLCQSSSALLKSRIQRSFYVSKVLPLLCFFRLTSEPLFGA
ncbi:hypothetical protein Tco_0324015 [Tanacetum coccineum]